MHKKVVKSLAKVVESRVKRKVNIPKIQSIRDHTTGGSEIFQLVESNGLHNKKDGSLF